MKAVFAYARMNPVTRGHLIIVESLCKEAEAIGAVPRLYLSYSQDDKRNPLDPISKQKFAQALFPQVEVRLAKTIIEAAKNMEADGIDEAVLLAGEDRAKDFTKLMQDYTGTDILGLKKTSVISIPREDVATATDAREAAKNEDWISFLELSPKGNEKIIHEMYTAVRAALGA